MLAAAFFAVYVCWGSTYLAIRVVVQNGLPPLLAAGVRMLIAGVLLAAFARVRRLPQPERSDWIWLAVSGVLYFLGGNGLVMIAETSVPSGVAALVVATTPVWLTGFESLLPGGERPGARRWLGIIIGLCGVMLLTGISDIQRPYLLLLLAPISWAAASLVAKHKLSKKPALVISSYQMLFGGAVLAVVGLGLGEASQWHPLPQAIGALVYLVIAGSLLGFVGFAYVVQHATAAQVGTYAYVNPVVAIILGAWLLDEPITSKMAAGALVILVGVVLVTLPNRRRSSSA